MSYEGYTEVLCARGHLRIFDAHDIGWSQETPWGEAQEATICGCGSPFVWSHEVDETNGKGQPYLLEIDQFEERDNCNLGFSHVVREVRYKIPPIAESR